MAPPATPYSFKFGSFNWLERFLKDTAEAGIKLDFLSFHYYGNISAIGKRPNSTVYPPFEQMMTSLREWIARYRPGLPLWITEWGPSYHTDKSPASLINGNHAGAAWSAAFIDAMLQQQVDGAIFLVTTDLKDNWGWPALFHGATPKPIYYIFSMFHRLQGQLLKVQGGAAAVGALAAQGDKRLAVVLWNYNWERGEFGAGQEKARQEEVILKLSGLPKKKEYRVTRALVSEAYGNPYALTLPGKTGSPEPQRSELGRYSSINGAMTLETSLPPSSVALLEFFPN
ncbi:MAG: glycosyl hydrolase [Desulfobaccales bacterium]